MSPSTRAQYCIQHCLHSATTFTHRRFPLNVQHPERRLLTPPSIPGLAQRPQITSQGLCGSRSLATSSAASSADATPAAPAAEGSASVGLCIKPPEEPSSRNTDKWSLRAATQGPPKLASSSNGKRRPNPQSQDKRLYCVTRPPSSLTTDET